MSTTRSEIKAARTAVLVVEDERIVAMDLQQTLLGMGYDACVASSADEAIARASEKPPDLVLMDIRIKGKRDGIETAGILRKQFGSPVVYLTAHADDAIIKRAMKTSPYGYLLKPVKSAQLRSAIEIGLFRHGLERELEEARASLELVSTTDELTGLLNRRGFMLIADQQLRVASRNKHKPILLFIDLNGLKLINDSLGHDLGDQALVETGDVLRQVFRTADVIGRLGGDEFVVLADDAAGSSCPTLAARLAKALAGHNALPPPSIQLSFSVGYAIYDPLERPTIEALIATADARMYEDKRRQVSLGARHSVERPVSVR